MALDLGLELVDGGGELQRPGGLLVESRTCRVSRLGRLGELDPLGPEGLLERAHVPLEARALLRRRLVGGGLFGERRLDLVGVLGAVLQLGLEGLDEFVHLPLAGCSVFTGRLGATLGVGGDLGDLVLGGGEGLTGLRQRILEVVDGARSDLLVLIERGAERLGILPRGLELRRTLAGLFTGGLKVLLEVVRADASRGELLLQQLGLASVGVGGFLQRIFGSPEELFTRGQVGLQLLATIASLGEGRLEVRGAGLVLLADGRQGRLQVGAGAPADLEVPVELLAASPGLLELAVERFTAFLGEGELGLQSFDLLAGLLELLAQPLAAILRFAQLLVQLRRAGVVFGGSRGHGLLDLRVRCSSLGELSVELLALLLGSLKIGLQLGGLGAVLLVAGAHGGLEAGAGFLCRGQLRGERRAALGGFVRRGLEGGHLSFEAGARLAGELFLGREGLLLGGEGLFAGREGLGLLGQGRRQLVTALDGFLKLGEGGLGFVARGLQLLLGAVAAAPELLVLLLQVGRLRLEGGGALVCGLELRVGGGQRLTDLFQLLFRAGELIPQPAGLTLSRVQAVRGLPELPLERVQGLDARGQLVDHSGLALQLDLLLPGGLVDPLTPCRDVVLELGHLSGPGVLHRELRGRHGGLLRELRRDPLVGVEGLLQASHLPCLLAQARAEGGLRAIEFADHPLHAVFHLHVDLVAFTHLAGHLLGKGGAFTAVSVLGDGEGEEGSGDGGAEAHKHGDDGDGHGLDVGIRPYASEDRRSNP